MIVEMARVEIIGLKKYLERVISILHTSGYLQIDDIREIPDVMLKRFTLTEKMIEEREEVDLLVANINGLVETFSSYKKVKKNARPESSSAETDDLSFYSIKNNVADITAQVQYLNMKKKTILVNQDKNL